MSRRYYVRVLPPIVMSAMLIAVADVAAGPQEKPQEPAPKVEKAAPIPAEPPPPAKEKDEEQKAREKVDKLIAAYDLKAHPLPAIPDDPPPHEGAMISLAHIAEPPDLIIVEVLEALPGRPISGERLVRSDGKISLGFYGEVDVRGLTLVQIKVAILKHLRKFLNDEALGLVVIPVEETEDEASVLKARIPEAPPQKNSFDPQDQSPAPGLPRSAKAHSSPKPVVPVRIPVRPVRARRRPVASQDQEPAAKESIPLKIEGIGRGKVTITIEFGGQAGQVAVPVPPAVSPSVPQDPGALPVRPAPRAAVEHEAPWQVIPPEESTHVFVDITAYNSQNYFVLGDILVPGKLPWTGSETVLDALQYAGGLIPSADPKAINLIRPGRAGKPSKVYKVDLEAIQDKGDVRSNYQLFPGDRLIFGRNEVVKKTMEIDRLGAPIESIAGSIQRIANSIRAVQAINPADTDVVLRELVNFWAKEIARKGDLKFDEDTLREALLQKRNATPAPDPKKQP